MRRRWALNENWDWTLIAMVWGGFALAPGMLVGNLIVGGSERHVNVGFLLGFLVAGLPVIPLGVRSLLKWLARIGPPVRRISEPVTTDLRASRDDG